MLWFGQPNSLIVKPPPPVCGALGVIGICDRACWGKVDVKVLIIQDDKETLEDISQAFQMCWPDAELISTPFGRRGIAQVRSESPEMVILDMNLPDMSGFDALKQVRCCSKVPVIVLSFLKGESGIVKSLGLGADAYIVKPFRQLEFIGHVRALLRKGNLNGV